MEKEKDLKRLSQEPGFGPEGSEEYQPKKNLEFNDDQGMTLDPNKKEAKQNALMQMLSSLGQRFQDNLRKSDAVNRDASAVMSDRIKMQMNPNLSGPPLPPISFSGEGAMPAEVAQSEMIGGAVMGSMAPVGKAAAAIAPEVKAALVKSGPWMKNITSEAVEAAIPKTEGLVHAAGDSIAKQAAIAQQKFRNLQRMLRK